MSLERRTPVRAQGQMVTQTAGACSKVTFSSEAEAMRCLVEIAFEPPRRWPLGKPTDCYPCNRCGGWHLYEGGTMRSSTQIWSETWTRFPPWRNEKNENDKRNRSRFFLDGNTTPSARESRKKPPPCGGLDVKICTNCRRNFPADAFPPNRHVSDGLSSWCRTCHNEATRRWRSREANAGRRTPGGRVTQPSYSRKEGDSSVST